MQISSDYNSLLGRISQLYGSTSKTNSRVAIQNSGSSESGSDQVELSEDYLNFQSFLDKVKNGTVTDDDLEKMKEEMSSSQMQMFPPPPMQMPGAAGNGQMPLNISGIDLGGGSLGITNTGRVSSTSGGSSTDSLTLQSFLDKVKDGTVTEDDLTEMQGILEEMDQNGPQGAKMPPPPMGMMGFYPDNSTESSDSDSTDSLTLQSFLDMVKDGTVTDEDLTEMQSLLQMFADHSVYTSGSSQASDI